MMENGTLTVHDCNMPYACGEVLMFPASHCSMAEISITWCHYLLTGGHTSCALFSVAAFLSAFCSMEDIIKNFS
jgi:hypothetical protein